jgi:hypothetical protein
MGFPVEVARSVRTGIEVTGPMESHATVRTSTTANSATGKTRTPSIVSRGVPVLDWTHSPDNRYRRRPRNGPRDHPAIGRSGQLSF